jgi:hypothetical protein
MNQAAETARRFSVAPMMDWIESSLKSNSWQGVVCNFCARMFYDFLLFVLPMRPHASPPLRTHVLGNVAAAVAHNGILLTVTEVENEGSTTPS